MKRLIARIVWYGGYWIARIVAVLLFLGLLALTACTMWAAANESVRGVMIFVAQILTVGAVGVGAMFVIFKIHEWAERNKD